MATGEKLVFKATVVKDYATWFAFEQAFVVGRDLLEQVEPAKEGV
jgi:hypothetical protein